jgi:hypothetical protein
MHQPPPSSQQTSSGASFLGLVLGSLVGLSGLVFLVFVTNGFFAWVVLIAVGIACFIGLHYLLWGRSFEHSIAVERAELLRAEAQDADG